MSLNNELPKIPRVNRIFLASVLLLTAIPAWKLFATLPTQGVVMDQVIPPEARPGDAVIIESPTFYVALQALERLGLRAIEVPWSEIEETVLQTAPYAGVPRAINAMKVLRSIQQEVQR